MSFLPAFPELHVTSAQPALNDEHKLEAPASSPCQP